MDKETKFKKFYDLLFRAIPSIDPQYMKFESVGLMDGFMERTYAYELYHQLRKFQDDLKYNDYFTIHAEPQKARTEFFHSILSRLKKKNWEMKRMKIIKKELCLTS